MSKSGNTMAVKKSVAFITGILCIIAIVLPFAPIPLRSYFSRSVRAQVAQLHVPDFQPPEVSLTLTQGDIVQNIESTSLTPLQSESIVLSGTATHTLEYQRQSPQFMMLSLAASNGVAQYQEEPCFQIFADQQQLYSLRCEYVTDTQLHTLILPVGVLDIQHVENIIFHSNLPEGITLTIETIYDSILVLTRQAQLELTAIDAHSVTVSTNTGEFMWSDSVYQLDTQEVVRDEVVEVEVTALDEYHNKSTVSFPIFVPSDAHSTAEHRVFAEPTGFHSLISVPNSSVWEPLYVYIPEPHTAQTADGQISGWYSVQRYGESLSFFSEQKKIRVFDHYLREYPLIETQ